MVRWGMFCQKVFVAEGSLANSAFQDVPEVVWPGNVMLKDTTSNVNTWNNVMLLYLISLDVGIERSINSH